MTAATCGVCGKPTDAFLCDEHLVELEIALGDVPALAEQLDIVIARQTRYSGRVGSRSTEAPLPYDPRASEAEWILHNTLTTWARQLSEQTGVPLPALAAERTAAPAAREPLTPAASPAVRRCEHTDLPTDSCDHCRRTT